MQCEWKLKSRKPKLSRQFKGCRGRIEYLNVLLQDEKWTSNSPLIKSQNLSVYLDEDYTDLIVCVDTYPLYWK
mgnify:FL=1